MISKVNSSSTIDVPTNMSGLVRKYHDRLLADDSLTDEDVLLLTIYLIEYKNQSAGANYENCKGLFVSLGRKEDNYRKMVYRARSGSLIEQRVDTLYLSIKGLKRFEEISGQVQKAKVYVIRSGESFTSIKLLEEFLVTQVTNGELLLCDPHVSPSTLFPLSTLKGRVRSMKILTSTVYEPERFEDYRKRMEKETGILVEVRISRKIHDRYLVSGEMCWSFGASIKDLGNKDTVIKEVSEVRDSMRDLFLERWNESESWEQKEKAGGLKQCLLLGKGNRRKPEENQL